MYSVVRLRNGKFLATCRIQDGTERREADTEIEAVQTVIGMARVYNGTYIRHDDIEFLDEPEVRQMVPTADELNTILKLRSKELVALPHNDKRIVYRLTDGECDLIIKIREGEVNVVQKPSA